MPAKCAVTGKTFKTTVDRSHSMQRNRRRRKPNLQVKKVVIGGKTQKVKVSTRALRTLKKKGQKLEQVLA